MVVKAEIIKQSKDTFSLSLRYGTKRGEKELIDLSEEEAVDPCMLLKSIPLFHDISKPKCPKGIYLFNVKTRNHVNKINQEDYNSIALMGVNETTAVDIMKVLDSIYDGLFLFPKRKLIVRLDKKQRPRVYNKSTRKIVANYLGIDA